MLLSAVSSGHGTVFAIKENMQKDFQEVYDNVSPLFMANAFQTMGEATKTMEQTIRGMQDGSLLTELRKRTNAYESDLAKARQDGKSSFGLQRRYERGIAVLHRRISQLESKEYVDTEIQKLQKEVDEIKNYRKSMVVIEKIGGGSINTAYLVTKKLPDGSISQIPKTERC